MNWLCVSFRRRDKREPPFWMEKKEAHHVFNQLSRIKQGHFSFVFRSGKSIII